MGAGKHAAILDVTIDGRIPHGTEVVVRAGHASAPATVGWLGGPFHQLRCGEPIAVDYGTAIEVAGLRGVVLDPEAPKHGPSNELLVRLTNLARGVPAS